MTKTKYPETATNYAREYLEQLLKMEDILSDGLDSRIRDTVRKYMEKKSKPKREIQ